MIRVVVADDHHLVRQGIRALLEKAEDIEVIGEASNGQEAVNLVRDLNPDVLVMDIAMPRMDGIQALGRVHSLEVNTQVVILSMYSDPTLVRKALRAGASSYLLKRSITEELLLAVRAASRNETFLSPAVSSSVVDDFLSLSEQEEETYMAQRLTPREKEVLQLIVEGQTNAMVAETLKISPRTVEKHRSSLMSKLDVRDVTGLVRTAIKHQLVFLDE